ncbi:MAG: hypothetical protein ACREFX_10790 [Opitutaceae bacterium]
MKTVTPQERIALRAGLWAAPLFAGSLLLFGALTPGFSQLHRAVSRLGSLRSPWGLWFGFFGFFLPGMLNAVVALILRRRLRAANAGSRWATGLLVYSLMMALTAVPADFVLMFASPWTWAHAFFVLGAPLVLFIVIPGCAKGPKALGASGGAIATLYVLGYLPIAESLLYVVLPIFPVSLSA